MSTENKQPALPYVSYPAFKSFIAHLHDTVITAQIDYTMMPRTMSGGVRAAIISALKTLGLTDAQGNTTQGLKSLIDAYNTKDWSEALKKYVLPAYSGIIGNIDLKSVTPKQMDSLFQDTSEQMKEKYLRFFLTVNKEAGIEYSPHLKIRRRTFTKRTTKTTQKSENVNNLPPAVPTEDKTPAGMFDQPIPIASAERSFIRVPMNITVNQAAMVKAIVAVIEAIAQQNEESNK
jgi:hypothetical protein